MPLRSHVYWICFCRHISDSASAEGPIAPRWRATAELKSNSVP